jgi:hypothetical protein
MRGTPYKKEPLLLQLVKNDFEYLWRYGISLLFPAILIELEQPVIIWKA